MSLRSISLWHWMLVSIAVGAAVGYARVSAEGDLSAHLGRGINGQRAFEEALLSVEQGRPRFADVSVHVRRVPDRRGGTKRVYVVAGSYFDGHYEKRDGKATAEWRPAFYIADAAAPYRPTAAWDRLGKAEVRRRFEAIANPTVADFLDCLVAAGKPAYSRAWWMGRGIAEWTVACFVVIGLLWPACVNLLLYGSLRAPPRERGIDLSKVRSQSVPMPATNVTAVELDRLNELATSMESELMEGASASAPPANTASPATPAVRKLKSEPAPTALPVVAADGPEYGMTQQDYYPSALHPPKARPDDE